MGSFDYYVSRWVAFLIAPAVTVAVALVAAKAKDWFGVDIDTTEIVALVLSTATGFVTWLVNRGRWEIRQHYGEQTALDVDTVLRLIETRLPAPPTAPNPGGGSPESPRAPGV